ncbi:hypothetical protein EXIGLDRAFT_755492 [Exidia glandulosa HHB12029]|uniref:Uncharacterized protein n=1 Tax=Exidia glandulosa HHB12029 TaxID=1314781 RepID=A0A165ZD21_EXIGL|nr:hypothetical protein EXIGLDRAFT_755492 [Exidia glandulosa HHB12029]
MAPPHISVARPLVAGKHDAWTVQLHADFQTTFKIQKRVKEAAFAQAMLRLALEEAQTINIDRSQGKEERKVARRQTRDQFESEVQELVKREDQRLREAITTESAIRRASSGPQPSRTGSRYAGVTVAEHIDDGVDDWVRQLYVEHRKLFLAQKRRVEHTLECELLRIAQLEVDAIVSGVAAQKDFDTERGKAKMSSDQQVDKMKVMADKRLRSEIARAEAGRRTTPLFAPTDLPAVDNARARPASALAAPRPGSVMQQEQRRATQPTGRYTPVPAKPNPNWQGPKRFDSRSLNFGNSGPPPTRPAFRHGRAETPSFGGQQYQSQRGRPETPAKTVSPTKRAKSKKPERNAAGFARAPAAVDRVGFVDHPPSPAQRVAVSTLATDSDAHDDNESSFDLLAAAAEPRKRRERVAAEQRESQEKQRQDERMRRAEEARQKHLQGGRAFPHAPNARPAPLPTMSPSGLLFLPESPPKPSTSRLQMG